MYIHSHVHFLHEFNRCFFVLFAGAFYFTLGNIKPENRSHQNAIQLLALVTTPFLKKYGPDDILNEFIQELHQLERVDA